MSWMSVVIWVLFIVSFIRAISDHRKFGGNSILIVVLIGVLYYLFRNTIPQWLGVGVAVITFMFLSSFGARRYNRDYAKILKVYEKLIKKLNMEPPIVYLPPVPEVIEYMRDKEGYSMSNPKPNNLCKALLKRWKMVRH